MTLLPAATVVKALRTSRWSKTMTDAWFLTHPSFPRHRRCATTSPMKIYAYPIAAVVVAALALTGVTNDLGAHHFWAQKVVWIGAPIGLVLALALSRLSKPLRLGLFFIGTAVAGAAAHYGKLQFAASYAEDRLAGQLWYFGWIGVAVMATALLVALLSPKS